MPFIASKLPHGLIIRHGSKEITLNGANTGENIKVPSPNGEPADNRNRIYGYGLTEVSDADVETFQAWSDAATYRNGKKEDGKLAEGFPALDNGSILGPFKTKAEAEKEVAAFHSSVTTGFEGLDPEAEAKKTGVTKAEK